MPAPTVNLPLDAGEIGDLVNGGAEAREQVETGGALELVTSSKNLSIGARKLASAAIAAAKSSASTAAEAVGPAESNASIRSFSAGSGV